jgi:serine protease
MRPSLPSLAVIVVAITFAAAPAPAAMAAGSPLTPVQQAAAQARPTLGTKAAATLARRLKRAKGAYAHGRYCAALSALGAIVRHTPSARVADSARHAQKAIFLAKAARRGACGLKKPTVKLSRAVKPAVAALPPLADGTPRPVARMDGGHGITTDFVADEVVVRTGDTAKLKAFVARWHGRVLADHGDSHLVRLDARHAPVDGLSDDLRHADPLSRGNLKVSSGQALGLVAVAADASAHGLAVGPNFVTDAARVLDRSSAETGSDGKPANAYNIWYNQPAPAGMGTGEAWRTLQIAGKTSNRVLVGVVDGGFDTKNNDLPSGTAADEVTNAMACSGGNPCPWHGTNVASTLASVVDDGKGVAGSGGQVADLRLVRMSGPTEFDAIDAVYDAFEHGARVINISSGYELDATVSVFNIPYEDATQTAREHGALVVASAGNDGRDVDAEDCFVVCWEEEWIAPCENDAVLCVGGLDPDGKRDAKSNFGYEWCGNAQDCNVGMFAPWLVTVAGDPVSTGVHNVAGTSFASPFVAGVAADVLAANPSLKPGEVEQILRSTAYGSSDPQVSRIVDADAAVRKALGGGNIAPLVEITQPSAGAQVPYGSFNTMSFRARAYDVESDDCCTFSWSSDVDGPLGAGSPLDAGFGAPGQRAVTVTATDKGGAHGTASVPVEAVNSPIKVVLGKPTPGATLYRNQPYVLEGSATDPNVFGAVPCSALKWTTRLDGQAAAKPLGDGCTPQATFTTNGLHHIILTATDPYGSTESIDRTITVADPPLHQPPLVTILSPGNGDGLDPATPVTLNAAANDPDGGAVTGTWTVKNGATTKVIGSGLQRSWKPQDDVPFHCGGTTVTLTFTATDSDGSTSASVDVHVDYPAC